jgi:hypothetical protein
MDSKITSRAELEQESLKQGILIERNDPVSNSKLLIPNFEKIKKMIREFDILVDGASRGKAVNEISRIERYLFEHENDPEAKSEYLAKFYSKASVFIEQNRSLMEDRESENWMYLFTSYFKLEDIFRYFNKNTGASSFFEDFRIYSDMVDLSFNVKMMDYLKSQIEITIPFETEKEIPGRIMGFQLKLAVLHELGLLENLGLGKKGADLRGMAKLLTGLLDQDPANWKNTLTILENMNLGNEQDILTETTLIRAREIVAVFGIDAEKK